MTQTHNLLTGTLLAAFLTMGLAAPSFAAKLSEPVLAPAPGTIKALTASEIDWGDDTSEWANDGECDDPRFEGEGTASELLDADRMKDATDCKAAFEAGTVTLIEDTTTPAATTQAPPANADIDWGDDTSEWANDGECDDPRFEGQGVAAELVDADRMKDATDCRTAFETGTITLKDGASDPANVEIANAGNAINWGDDSSQWANDGECDDPRFEGEGVASELLDEDATHDATDCRTAYEAGTITLKDTGSTSTANAEIDWGNDSSEWANDGECDDPRFEGEDMAAEPVNTDLLKDATDCRTAFEDGTITLKADADAILAAANEFDYGSDFSRWAEDGECDDPRFTGEGMAKKLLSEDMKGDATDCRALVESGSISIIPVWDPAYAAGAPYDSKGVDFGDNTSSYADDGQCDDPRFQGPGVASTLLDSDLKHDRNDCKAAFEAGTIVLI